MSLLFAFRLFLPRFRLSESTVRPRAIKKKNTKKQNVFFTNSKRIDAKSRSGSGGWREWEGGLRDGKGFMTFLFLNF